MNTENSRPLRVTILNYHEFSQDSRVLKQARALVEAGHNVTVYCNKPSGFSEIEKIGRITVKRFPCFEQDRLDKALSEEFPFLSESHNNVLTRFNFFVDITRASLEVERAARRLKDLRSGLARDLPLAKTYYKSRKGLDRILRKIQYNSFRRQHSEYTFAENDALEKRLAESLRSLNKTQSEFWRSLETVRAIVFLQNLLRYWEHEQADVVHAHDLMTLPAGVVLRQQTGAKLVYDAHEYEPERAGLSPEARVNADQMERDCLTKVDGIVTVSKGIARLYAGRFLGEYPTLVYNSPDLEQPQAFENCRKLREQLEMPASVPLIVYIGNIQRENRGVDKLVEALVHLPGYHLANVGPRKTANDEWIRKISVEAGVSDRLHLLEPVRPQDVPYVVSDASVAASASQNICLSYLHSMPNKLFEATFAGLPVCVPDRPDQKEFVSLLGHGIAMDQGDPKAIASAIRTVVDNRSSYLLSDRAQQLLSEEYSWNAQKKRLLDLYVRLTARGDEYG